MRPTGASRSTGPDSHPPSCSSPQPFIPTTPSVQLRTPCDAESPTQPHTRAGWPSGVAERQGRAAGPSGRAERGWREEGGVGQRGSVEARQAPGPGFKEGLICREGRAQRLRARSGSASTRICRRVTAATIAATSTSRAPPRMTRDSSFTGGYSRASSGVGWLASCAGPAGHESPWIASHAAESPGPRSPAQQRCRGWPGWPRTPR